MVLRPWRLDRKVEVSGHGMQRRSGWRRWPPGKGANLLRQITSSPPVGRNHLTGNRRTSCGHHVVATLETQTRLRENSGMSRRATNALEHDGKARESRVCAVESLRLADGRGLCVRRWAGTGDQTLVLLHGLLDSSEGWGRLCEGVSCSLIAFDLPGFGYSDPPVCGSIEGYARDVADGLNMLGIERFTVIGHSLGGAVATALAEMLPDRVAGLVLLAPAGFGRIHLAEAISIPGIRNVVEGALPFALRSRLAVTASYVTMVTNGRIPDSGLIDRVTSRGNELVDGAREGTRAVVEAGRSADAFHRRRLRYRGPVFAVWGDRDRLVPVAHHKGVLAALPHAEVQIWKGMGHHPLRERFDDLTELIAQAAAATQTGTRHADRRRRKAA